MQSTEGSNGARWPSLADSLRFRALLDDSLPVNSPRMFAEPLSRLTHRRNAFIIAARISRVMLSRKAESLALPSLWAQRCRPAQGIPRI